MPPSYTHSYRERRKNRNIKNSYILCKVFVFIAVKYHVYRRRRRKNDDNKRKGIFFLSSGIEYINSLKGFFPRRNPPEAGIKGNYSALTLNGQ